MADTHALSERLSHSTEICRSVLSGDATTVLKLCARYEYSIEVIVAIASFAVVNGQTSVLRSLVIERLTDDKSRRQLAWIAVHTEHVLAVKTLFDVGMSPDTLNRALVQKTSRAMRRAIEAHLSTTIVHDRDNDAAKITEKSVETLDAVLKRNHVYGMRSVRVTHKDVDALLPFNARFVYFDSEVLSGSGGRRFLLLGVPHNSNPELWVDAPATLIELDDIERQRDTIANVAAQRDSELDQLAKERTTVKRSRISFKDTIKVLKRERASPNRTANERIEIDDRIDEQQRALRNIRRALDMLDIKERDIYERFEKIVVYTTFVLRRVATTSGRYELTALRTDHPDIVRIEFDVKEVIETRDGYLFTGAATTTVSKRARITLVSPEKYGNPARAALARFTVVSSLSKVERQRLEEFATRIDRTRDKYTRAYTDFGDGIAAESDVEHVEHTLIDELRSYDEFAHDVSALRDLHPFLVVPSNMHIVATGAANELVRPADHSNWIRRVLDNHEVHLTRDIREELTRDAIEFDARVADYTRAYRDVVAAERRDDAEDATAARVRAATHDNALFAIETDARKRLGMTVAQTRAALDNEVFVTSHAIEHAKLDGRSSLSLRVHFNYEADLAGGAAHQFASEYDPVLHVFATHKLGVLDRSGDDDGVVVVATSDIVAQLSDEHTGTSKEPRIIVIDAPFNPAGVQTAVVSDDALWALPGARSTRDYTAPDEHGRWALPADASLAFNAYAETATQHGQIARTRVGESLFLLSELLDVSTDTREDDLHAEWQTTGDEPLVKGFVSVRGVELVHHTADGRENVVAWRDYVHIAEPDTTTVFHAEDHDSTVQRMAVALIERQQRDVNSSQSVFFPQGVAPLGTSRPNSMRRMHCPYYNTSAGLVTGSAYALRLPRTAPPAAFFERALEVATRRNGTTVANVLRAADAQARSPHRTLDSSRHITKVMVEMLTVYATAMVYLDDFTNDGGRTLLAQPIANDGSALTPDASRRSSAHSVRLVRSSNKKAKHIKTVEDFKIGRLGHGDDCEGVSKEIYMQYWQFRRTSLDTLGDSDARHVLAYMQQMARDNVYTPVMVLAAVTNKKLDVATHALGDEDVLAHTYTAFIKTATLLERLEDASSTGRLSGLSKRIRSTRYVREEFKPRAWHGALDTTLIAEGTARSSAFVRPIVDYYSTSRARDTAKRVAAARLSALGALVDAGLPMNVVSVEVPQRRLDDADGAIAANRADVSDFYKINSAFYVSAFRESGVLDVAFASRNADGTRTHAVHFNRFAARTWDKNVRLVPYNPLTSEQGAITDNTLAQLEPIPTLRRSTERAADIERTGAPASLRALEKLFGDDDGGDDNSTVASGAMPLPPHNIVVTLRAEDVSDEVSERVVRAVEHSRTHFSRARVHTYYLSDEPVRGDETSLPPVVLYDVELQLHTEHM